MATLQVPATHWTTSRAGVVRRVGAFAADLVLVSVLVGATAWLVPRGVLLGPVDLATSLTTRNGWLVLQAVVGWGVNALWFVGGWSRGGATQGQRLLGLQLVDPATGQLGLSVPRALLRWGLLVVPTSLATTIGAWAPLTAAFVWALAGVWWAVLLVSTLRAGDGPALHDRIVGAEVRRVM